MGQSVCPMCGEPRRLAWEMTGQFIEQADPRALQSELLRLVREGVERFDVIAPGPSVGADDEHTPRGRA